MSDLGYLERLLDGAAVKWVPLGEVCIVKTGPNINKELIVQSPGPYPVINSGREPLGYFDQWNSENDPIGITSRGAGVGYVMWTNGRFFRGNLNYSCAPKKSSSLNTRFLYHFLLLSEAEIQSLATYQGIPALNASALKTLPIPIPCPEDPQKSLAIQGEIVRTLDAFTALTAELTAELTARKTQYNHYRNQLLSFEGGEVDWKTLGEVFTTIKTGKLNANAMVEDGEYPFFTCDANPFKIDTFAFDTEAIIVSGNGSQVGHINYYNGKFNAYQRTYVLADCVGEVTMGFLLTYLKAYLRTYIMQHSKKGSVPYITMPMLQSFKVPVPSLTEQARIATILDTFDTLTTSLSDGYQIAATERIMWKIKCAYEAKSWSKPESGGYIWHTTGSGKTLTSFKAARLATELPFIDKVFFVVDRKDLDYQTMKEYQKFSPDSVNGSDSTAGLKRNLEKDDNKIVVTTIQKLNNLMKGEADLPIYRQQVVFIFDECHRSQFGEAQKNLKRKFKRFYQFGFTGTPIFGDDIVDGKLIRKGNALGAETTASVFGRELHSYVITDAIRDEKVLKFKVDYNDVRPQFKSAEVEQDEKKLSSAEIRQALLHPERIREVSHYILTNFKHKTHRMHAGSNGFNAMFAVSSVDAAKAYYETLKKLQVGLDKPLKIATIFSFAANEEQDAIGDIQDEGFDVSAMNSSAKEFLNAAIADYNAYFKTKFGIDGLGFQNYYRDLANRVRTKEIDLLIVVGMFLTGFDAPSLNTLFVDKNLRFHGLIQAFSRTNRIFDATKTFGNIVAFRDIEQATIDAITLFGDKNTRNVVLEKSYDEYLTGFQDQATGALRRGFIEVVRELEDRFPDPDEIVKEADKKDFVKVFGEYLKIESILRNYDEFTALQNFNDIDANDETALRKFKEVHHLTDDGVDALRMVPLPTEREVQNYRSTYNDIRDWLRRETASEEKDKLVVNWDDVVFEVELLKSQEINLDYILELIFEKARETHDKGDLIEDARRVIRASLGSRAKESLLIDFINKTDLDLFRDKASVIDAFFAFAQGERTREVEALIQSENLDSEAAKRYISASIKREFASENGADLNSILPRMSPLHPQFRARKATVFEKISSFVEKFKGVGGQL